MMTISFDVGLHFSVNNIPKVRRRDGTEDLQKTLGIVSCSYKPFFALTDLRGRQVQNRESN